MLQITTEGKKTSLRFAVLSTVFIVGTELVYAEMLSFIRYPERDKNVHKTENQNILWPMGAWWDPKNAQPCMEVCSQNNVNIFPNKAMLQCIRLTILCLNWQTRLAQSIPVDRYSTRLGIHNNNIVPCNPAFLKYVRCKGNLQSRVRNGVVADKI